MDDKAIAAAAIERLEAEQQRRRDERVARGEAVLVPLPCVVVASDEEADGAIEDVRARTLAELRKTGEARQIIFDEPFVLITGVPECDESFGGEAKADTAPASMTFSPAGR
jgi:hypothetical protein